MRPPQNAVAETDQLRVLRRLVASCGKLCGFCPRKRPNSYPSSRLSMSTNSRNPQSEGNAHRRAVLRISQRAHFQLREERFGGVECGIERFRQVAQTTNVTEANVLQHSPQILA